jgi:midasin
LINNYSSNKNSIHNFSISDINNFCLFINKYKYEFLFQSNYIESKNDIEQKNMLDNSDDFLYLSSLKSINEKLNLLSKEENKLTKILFYGEKCGGKTTLAKEILNNPLIIDIDESLETNYLLGEYLINEFSEIIWQDGILLSALKQGKDILLLSMEKSGNDFICILKQILENNSLFIPSKQETLYGFESKIIMIYNIPNPNDIKKLMSINPLFNFLSSNSYSFYFKPYNTEEIMEICKYKYGLNRQEINIFNKMVSLYNSIPSKFKINTRYKYLSLNNILYNAKLLHEFFVKNNLINEIKDKENNSNELNNENENGVFINERLMMNLVALFIYNNLLTIENMTLLKSITELYSTEFNFNYDSFSNVVFNLEEKYTFNTSEFNYITTFEGNKIFYDDIPKGDFYSYNTNSKFYIKLINNSIINNNNILLVGETGVGKTRMIQNLAKLMNIKLNVINMSQSSDEGDLLGGFKPVSTKNFLKKYFNEILNILSSNSIQKKIRYLSRVCIKRMIL